MVKCSDCGYLTLRNSYTGQLDEADSDFRASGNPPRRMAIRGVSGNTVATFGTPYIHIPICFAQAINLQAEFLVGGAGPKGDYPGQLVQEIIQKERICPPVGFKGHGFTEWVQGFTPKEHREMLDRQWRLDHETRVRNEAIKREDARDALSAQREDARDARVDEREDKRDKEARERHHSELIVFGVILGTLTIIAAFIDGHVRFWPF